MYELFVNHKNDEDFKKIKVNTLVITGEQDVGSTVEMSKELDNIIQNSQLKIIEDGKHLCGIECADCLLYTSPSPRDVEESRMPSSA